jgi:hypothetical protein
VVTSYCREYRCVPWRSLQEAEHSSLTYFMITVSQTAGRSEDAMRCITVCDPPGQTVNSCMSINTQWSPVTVILHPLSSATKNILGSTDYISIVPFNSANCLWRHLILYLMEWGGEDGGNSASGTETAGQKFNIIYKCRMERWNQRCTEDINITSIFIVDCVRGHEIM